MSKVQIGVDDMSKFIYVFDTDARDTLLAAGYKLLKRDEKNNISVFENISCERVNFENMQYVFSDILTF